MKYYIYSAMCYNKSLSSVRPMYYNGVFKGDSIIELYEMAATQLEDWCLTHVAQITKEEYYTAKDHGIIG